MVQVANRTRASSRTIPLSVEGVSPRCGDHICGFYRDAAERNALTVPFIGEGLVAGDLCAYFVDEQTAKDFKQRLQAQYSQTAAALASGQLEITSSRQTYLLDNHFSPERMLGLLRAKIAQVPPNSDVICRVCGEMTWALSGLPGVEDLLEYEARVNYLSNEPQVAICLYNVGKFGGDIIIQLLKTHPLVIMSGMVIENPYYIPPERYLRQLRERRA